MFCLFCFSVFFFPVFLWLFGRILEIHFDFSIVFISYLVKPFKWLLKVLHIHRHFIIACYCHNFINSSKVYKLYLPLCLFTLPLCNARLILLKRISTENKIIESEKEQLPINTEYYGIMQRVKILS